MDFMRSSIILLMSYSILLLNASKAYGQIDFANCAFIKYTINTELKDEEVKINYWVEFKKDTSDKKILKFETSSLDTFCMLMVEDLSHQPVAKQNVLYFIHGMFGGVSMNYTVTQNRLHQYYVDRKKSDIGRVLTIKWPASSKIYKINKRRAKQIASGIGNSLFRINQTLLDYYQRNELNLKPDILAHSLGNELFKEIILCQDDEQRCDMHFDQVLLCAPDLDIDILDADSDFSAITQMCNRVTVHFSEKDFTLGVSKKINKKGRLGFDGPSSNHIKADNLYFVSMKNISDEDILPMKLTGHAYYKASAIGSEDILCTLIGQECHTIDRRVKDDTRNNCYILKQ